MSDCDTWYQCHMGFQKRSGMVLMLRVMYVSWVLSSAWLPATPLTLLSKVVVKEEEEEEEKDDVNDDDEEDGGGEPRISHNSSQSCRVKAHCPDFMSRGSVTPSMGEERTRLIWILRKREDVIKGMVHNFCFSPSSPFMFSFSFPRTSSVWDDDDDDDDDDNCGTVKLCDESESWSSVFVAMKCMYSA